MRYTVRVTGVDTPETTHPTRGVEPYGPEAAEYTTARLTGATVRLVHDPAGDDHDAYGRIFRSVILAGGEDFNATLIRTGTPPPFGAFPTLDTLSFYSWKPRRAPRAVGCGADDDRHAAPRKHPRDGDTRHRHPPGDDRADGVQRWIAQARRAGRRPAFAVRNLPAGISPGRAADLMEATAAAGRERKRRAGLKGWHAASANQPLP